MLLGATVAIGRQLNFVIFNTFLAPVLSDEINDEAGRSDLQ